MADFTGAIFSADSIANASYAADNLGDERFSVQAGERWQSSNALLPHWAQRDENVPKVATWYRIDPGRAGTDPTAWELRGSADPTFASYTVLDSRSGQSFSTGQTKTYEFVNTLAFRYHRLHITGSQTGNAASSAEWEMGDGEPPGATWEHSQASATSSSNNGTGGLVHVVNTTIEVTHLQCYVGSITATYQMRIRDAAGVVVATASVAVVSGVDAGWRRAPVDGGPVILAPGVYMVEHYSGGRIGQRSGTYPTDVSYGPNNEVTIPAAATVTFRGTNHTARYSNGNVEPTILFGAHALVGMRFNTPAATAHELEGIGGNTAWAGTSSALQRDATLDGTGGDTAWVGDGAAIVSASGLAGAGGLTEWVGSGAALQRDATLDTAGGLTEWVGSGAAIDAPDVDTSDIVGVGGLTEWTGTPTGISTDRDIVGVGGLTAWVGQFARISHPVVMRDVIVDGICELPGRTVSVVEIPIRETMVCEMPTRVVFITVTEGSTMEIHAKERNFLPLQITTTPPLANWELSLDGGDTWHMGESIPDVTGGFRWLLSGADFVPPVGDLIPSITVPRSGIVPLLRAVDSPEVIIEKAPQAIIFE